MAELLKNIQSYWDMRAGGFSDASMEERKTEPGERWENIFKNSFFQFTWINVRIDVYIYEQ